MSCYLNTLHNEQTREEFILVPLNTFPKTLKNTHFYKSMYENYKHNPKLPIPIGIYKNEMNLSILNDMMLSLIDLSTMFPDGNLPYSNYDFIVSNRNSIRPYFTKLKNDFKTFDFVNEMEILVNIPENEILKILILNNRKRLLKYCLKNKLFNVTPQLTFDMASEYFRIDLLEYVYKNYNKELQIYNESNDMIDNVERKYK